MIKLQKWSVDSWNCLSEIEDKSLFNKQKDLHFILDTVLKKPPSNIKEKIAAVCIHSSRVFLQHLFKVTTTQRCSWLHHRCCFGVNMPGRYRQLRVKEFVTVVPYDCTSMCANVSKKRTTFAEVTQQSVEHSYNTRTLQVIQAYLVMHVISLDNNVSCLIKS